MRCNRPHYSVDEKRNESACCNRIYHLAFYPSCGMDCFVLYADFEREILLQCYLPTMRMPMESKRKMMIRLKTTKPDVFYRPCWVSLGFSHISANDKRAEKSLKSLALGIRAVLVYFSKEVPNPFPLSMHKRPIGLIRHIVCVVLRQTSSLFFSMIRSPGMCVLLACCMKRPSAPRANAWREGMISNKIQKEFWERRRKEEEGSKRGKRHESSDPNIRGKTR